MEQDRSGAGKGRGGAHLKPRDGAKSVRRIGMIALCVMLGLVAALTGATYLYPNVHAGVHVGGVAVGGMTREEAAHAIASESVPAILEQEIEVTVGDAAFSVSIGDAIETLDQNTAAQAAYDYTHTGNPFTRMSHVLSALVTRRDFPLEIVVNRAGLESQLAEIETAVTTAPVAPSWTLSGDHLVVDVGKAGMAFNRDTVLREMTERIETMNVETYEVRTMITNQAPVDMEKIKGEADSPAKNATVDKNDGKTILPAQDGIVVDLAQANKVLAASDAQTYSIPVERTPAKVTQEQLKTLLFRDTLGSAVTKFGSSNASRANNVELSSSFINGTILNPGDEFSYNEVVGERTIARGFSEAGAYLAGKLVDEVGGGVCQPSSTLYMAVLRADLKVSERTNHGLTVSYTPLGEDATVSYGQLDFRFINSTDYPVKLVVDSSDRKLRMSIVGTNITGKTVTTDRVIEETLEPKLIEKTDTSLPAGTTRVDQTPMTGYRVVTYKLITENGQTTKVKANTSTYKKRDKIVLHGPAASAPVPAPAKTPAVAPPTAAPPAEAPASGTDPEALEVTE